jgi:hypothetical protein
MRAAYAALAAALLIAACDTSGTEAATGLEASLRVAGGTYFAGAMPAAEDGPAVLEINSNNNNVHPGQIGKKLAGRLATGSNAVALQLADDPGYWVLPAGVEDANNPGNLLFDARLNFARDLPAGTHELSLRAVDATGHFGAASTLVLTAADATPSTLKVSLSWDSESDLDLHLQLPGDAPVIVWAQNINSYQAPPPPEQPDPAQAAAGGILDFDSNAQCAIDGRRQENIVWTQPPPSGTYQARVDAFSLCGQASAHWTMVVTLGDDEIAHAEGTLGEDATRTAHDAAAGSLALTFDVP